MRARGDVPNNPETNGEYALVGRLLRALKKDRSDPKLLVFDVGANVGDWARNALDMARELRFSNVELHAFEPVPSTRAALLAAMAAYSSRATVHVRAIALSSITGEGSIHVTEELSGTNSLHAGPENHEARKVTIKLSTLDDYCSAGSIDQIFFVKCDAEGHDMEVLLGARGCLERGIIGLFQFEYNHRWVYARHFLKDVFDFADGMRYRIGKVLPNRVELIDNWHPELERFFECNYLLVHRSMVPLLSAKTGEFDAYNTFALTK